MQADWKHLIMIVFHSPFFLNGNTVYNLDTSSSLIHALTILHAWVHSIRKFLFIHMGAHVPSLGENKIN